MFGCGCCRLRLIRSRSKSIKHQSRKPTSVVLRVIVVGLMLLIMVLTDVAPSILTKCNDMSADWPRSTARLWSDRREDSNRQLGHFWVTACSKTSILA